MARMRIVVDTNVVFAALLGRESRLREALLADGEHAFYSPRFVMVEIFKRKERIAAASQLGSDEILDCLNAILGRIRFLDDGAIPLGTWMESRRLCSGVDPKDTPFVTPALHLDGHPWTADGELEAGLRTRGFERFYRP